MAQSIYPWQPPKVEYSIEDQVFDTDFERMERNTLSLRNTGMPYGVLGGVANSYTLTMVDMPTLADSLSLRISVTQANTGASTLNLNSLGVFPIVKETGVVLGPDDLAVGAVYQLTFRDSNWYLTGTGAQRIHFGAAAGINDYTVTVPGIGEFRTGEEIVVQFTLGSSAGTNTLNVNGLGVKPLLDYRGAPLNAGDISAGVFLNLTYDGSAWRLSSPLTMSGVTSADESYQRVPHIVIPTGTVNALVATVASLVLRARDTKLILLPTGSNTGAVTIALNGGAAKAVKYVVGGAKTALPAGMLLPGWPVMCIYDGTDWVYMYDTKGIKDDISNLQNSTSSELEKLTQELLETNRKLMTVGIISSLKDMPDYSVYDFLDSTDQDTGTTATYDSTGKKYDFSGARQLLKIKDDQMDTFNTLGVRCYNSALTKVKVVNTVSNSNTAVISSLAYSLSVGDRLLMTEASTGLPKACTITGLSGATKIVSDVTQKTVAGESLAQATLNDQPRCKVSPIDGLMYAVDYDGGTNLELMRFNDDGTLTQVHVVNTFASQASNVYNPQLDISPDGAFHISYTVFTGNTNYVLPAYIKISSTYTLVYHKSFTNAPIGAVRDCYRMKLIVFDNNRIAIIRNVGDGTGTILTTIISSDGGNTFADNINNYVYVKYGSTNISSEVLLDVILLRSGNILLLQKSASYLYGYVFSWSDLIASTSNSTVENLLTTSSVIAFGGTYYANIRFSHEHPTINNKLYFTTWGADSLRHVYIVTVSGYTVTLAKQSSYQISVAGDDINVVTYTYVSVENDNHFINVVLKATNTTFLRLPLDEVTGSVNGSQEGLTNLGIVAPLGNVSAMVATRFGGAIPTGIHYIVCNTAVELVFRRNYSVAANATVTLDTPVNAAANSQPLITTQYIVKQNGTELAFKEAGTAWGQDYVEYKGAVASTSTAKVSVEGKSTKLEALAYYNDVA